MNIFLIAPEKAGEPREPRGQASWLPWHVRRVGGQTRDAGLTNQTRSPPESRTRSSHTSPEPVGLHSYCPSPRRRRGRCGRAAGGQRDGSSWHLSSAGAVATAPDVRTATGATRPVPRHEVFLSRPSFRRASRRASSVEPRPTNCTVTPWGRKPTGLGSEPARRRVSWPQSGCQLS